MTLRQTLLLSIAGMAAAPSLALAQIPDQAAAERMRANEQMLRDQQVQSQLNDLQQRQTNLEIQQRSADNLRQLQEQSLRAPPPLTLPTYSSTAGGVRPPVAATPPPIAITPEEDAAAKKAAKAKKKAAATGSKPNG